MNVDIGSGARPYGDYRTVDNDPQFNPDYLCDVNNGLPFPDGTVDNIYCSHFLEHCKDPTFIFKEMHRVCKRGAKIVIIVPLFEWYSHDHLHTFFPGYFHRNIDTELFDVEHVKIIEPYIENRGMPYYIFEKHLILTAK